MRTLIVEDDFTGRLLLQELLRNYGECIVAEDGVQAMKVFEENMGKKQLFDVICLDIMMPGMDGQQVLKKIRSIEDTNPPGSKTRTKIIMTTALTDKSNVFMAFREQCDAYLPKPIFKEKLEAILAEFGFSRT